MDEDGDLLPLDTFDGHQYIVSYFYLAEHHQLLMSLEYEIDATLFWNGTMHLGVGAIHSFWVSEVPRGMYHPHHDSLEVYPMFDGTLNGARLIRLTGCVNFVGSQQVTPFSQVLVLTEYNNQGWRIMVDYFTFGNGY